MVVSQHTRAVALFIANINTHLPPYIKITLAPSVFPKFLPNSIQQQIPNLKQMAISPNTASELLRIVASVDILLTVPDVQIKKIPADDRQCPICHERFAKNEWKVGEMNNSPVRIACGHVFGMQCLARLLFSTQSSVPCPLCRAEIVPEVVEDNLSNLAWDLVTPVLRLFLSFGQNMARDVWIQSLESLETTLGSRNPSKVVSVDRPMIIYDELHEQFCRCSAAAQRAAQNQAANDDRIRLLEELLQESQDHRDRRTELLDSYRALHWVEDASAEQPTNSLCQNHGHGQGRGDLPIRAVVRAVMQALIWGFGLASVLIALKGINSSGQVLSVA